VSNNLRKTVIITGGNRGIGLHISEKFALNGWNVFVGSRSNLEMDLVNVTHVTTDVRQEEDHKKLISHALLKTGRVDVYINNAGFSEWRPINQIDEEFLNNIIATNLKSAFWGCKAAADVLKSGSSIINISSIAGKRGSSNNSAYVATKFGMNGMTQSLAKELGPRGIRVNGICPVLVPTPGLMTALESDYSPAKGKAISWMNDFATSQSALQRLPTGQQVADTCYYLASDQAGAITGQNINVDCGVFPQ